MPMVVVYSCSVPAHRPNGKVLMGKTSQEGIFKASNIGCGAYEVLFDEGEDDFEPSSLYAQNPVLQANPNTPP